MNRSNTALATAIAGVIGLLGAATAHAADPLVFCKEQEKCYGVSRAGKNDCSTSSSVCAGTAKSDYQKDAWIYLPKGTCERLAGGALKPPAKK
jgi:uncharacterized membrane protein